MPPLTVSDVDTQMDTGFAQQWVSVHATVAGQLGKPLIMEEVRRETSAGRPHLLVSLGLASVDMEPDPSNICLPRTFCCQSDCRSMLYLNSVAIV
jgi:hypothetical protein